MKNKTLFSHLICPVCNKVYAKSQIQTYCKICNSPLLVCYDLAKSTLKKADLKNRPKTMWRYRALLPVENDAHIVSLGEGFTPLLEAANLNNLGLKKLYIKDESGNPTASFKARGLSMAISMAKQFGLTKVAIPTAGNAGSAMSAYAAKARMEAHVFMPKATPSVFRQDCSYFGASIVEVDGSIRDCGKAMAALNVDNQWFDVSTLKEPYRLEGKKTMGFEIAEQLNWQLPDVVIYPAGGGTGLIGIWKAFHELKELGWISDIPTRMVCVQAVGCAPIAKIGRAHV